MSTTLALRHTTTTGQMRYTDGKNLQRLKPTTGAPLPVEGRRLEPTASPLYPPGATWQVCNLAKASSQRLIPSAGAPLLEGGGARNWPHQYSSLRKQFSKKRIPNTLATPNDLLAIVNCGAWILPAFGHRNATGLGFCIHPGR